MTVFFFWLIRCERLLW